jgi:hypothetical protein
LSKKRKFFRNFLGRAYDLKSKVRSQVATEVGGAFVNGTAEEVFNRGLLWCIAPAGYSIRNRFHESDWA